MKKISFLLCLFVAFTVFNCQNETLDEDLLDITNPGVSGNPSGSTEGLVGEWELVSFTSTVNTLSNAAGTEIESNVDIESTTTDYIMIFEASTFSAAGSYEYNTDLTVAGTNITDSYLLEDVTGSGSYTTSGNTMTVDGAFYEFTYEGIEQPELDADQTAQFEITNNGETLTFTESSTETQELSGFSVQVTKTGMSIWARIGDGNVGVDCDLQATTDEAATAYNNDTSDATLCNAYKTALQNQITECGDTDGSLQAIVDDLGECTPVVVDVEITLTAGTLPIEFDEVTVELVGTTLQVTGESSISSYSIYFEVEEGVTGASVIDDTFEVTLTSTFYPSELDAPFNFVSEITVNETGTLTGSFYGVVTNADGGDLNLYSGDISITY
ncbi:hypothetical protein [Lacinutrix undariae]